MGLANVIWKSCLGRIHPFYTLIRTECSLSNRLVAKPPQWKEYSMIPVSS